MKRVGIVVVLVFAIVASAALGLNKDAATRRTLKAVEYTEAQAVLCKDLATVKTVVIYGMNCYEFGCLEGILYVRARSVALSKDAVALRNAGDEALAATVDSLATHLRRESTHIQVTWSAKERRERATRADMLAIPTGMCPPAGDY